MNLSSLPGRARFGQSGKRREVDGHTTRAQRGTIATAATLFLAAFSTILLLSIIPGIYNDRVLVWNSGNVMWPPCGSSILRRDVIEYA